MTDPKTTELKMTLMQNHQIGAWEYRYWGSDQGLWPPLSVKVLAGYGEGRSSTQGHKWKVPACSKLEGGRYPRAGDRKAQKETRQVDLHCRWQGEASDLARGKGNGTRKHWPTVRSPITLGGV